MPVPTYRAPSQGSKSWGLFNFLKDFISPPGYVPRGPFGARAAGAQPLPEPPPGANTTITTGLNTRGEVDRTKSDLYKQYAFTPEGQFERYFKTPEFDYVFGAQTSNEPKTAAEMAALSTQRNAPTTSSLSDYYRSQSAMGRVNQAAIQEMYKDRPDLQKWAAENPMLAQREYTKKYGTTDITKQAAAGDYFRDLGGGAQAESGYTREAFGLPANPVPPTQQPGPGGMNQGDRVSFFRGVENIAPLQAAKTIGGQPQFKTILSETENFLKGFGK